MKPDIRPKLLNLGISLACTALILLVFPGAAFASLGDNVASVEVDRVRLQGKLQISQGTSYSVHEIRTASGIVVRQYVSPGGTVFGLAWQGQAIPNLRQLLGAYFDRFAQAAQVLRRGRAPIVIDEPGLVLHFGGHPRAFFGSAYLPPLLPPNVTPEDIR